MSVHTQNYVFPANSPRHPNSRKVKISVDLSQVAFRDGQARQKMIDLLGERYDKTTNILTIASDRCPTRQQNKDYLIYLLKVLYLESHKIEPQDNL
jgi:small subunit ribosomal protein S35